MAVVTGHLTIMLSVAVPVCNQHERTIRSISNILSATPRGQLKLTLWPSGDFSIGMRSVPRADKGEHPLEGIEKDPFGVVWKDRPAQPAGSLEDQVKVLMKLIDLADERGDSQERDRLASKLEGLLTQLGLVDARNPHNRPRRYSQGGITPYGKKMVKSAAVLLSEQYGGCIGFGTLTLPPLSPEQLAKVCQNWSDLTRKFFQELRRELERQGLPQKFVYVSEIQPDRYKKWGQLCPHLHFLYVGKRKKWHTQWRIGYDWFPKIWARLLSNLLGQEVEAGYSSRVEKAKGDLLQELGKYMSKGGEILSLVKERGESHLLPRGYWGVQSELRKQVKSAIQTSTSVVVETLVASLKEFKSLGFLQFREVKAQISDAKSGAISEIVVGFCGWFRANSVQEILQNCVEKWMFSAKKGA